MMRITKTPLVSLLNRTPPPLRWMSTVGMQRASLCIIHDVRPLSSLAACHSSFSVAPPGISSSCHSQWRWSSSSSSTESSETSSDSNQTTKEEESVDPAANSTNEAEANATEGEDTKVEEANAELEEAVDDLAAVSDLLRKEVRDMKDALRRSLADQENTRTIARRDVSQAREFAIKGFAKSLLDVADNLQRALLAVPEEYRPHAAEKDDAVVQEEHPMQTTFMKLYEGIEMTEKGLQRAFASHGLRPFGQVGEPFDPSKHEALMDYDDPKSPHNSIGILMKCGYTLHDRVLRPAEVGVVLHKTPPPEASSTEAKEPSGAP